jgi:hypothetical protein
LTLSELIGHDWTVQTLRQRRRAFATTAQALLIARLFPIARPPAAMIEPTPTQNDRKSARHGI